MIENCRRVMSIFVLSMMLVVGIGCENKEPEPADPNAKTIRMRQENFKALGTAMKTIEDQTKSSSPDMKAVAKASEQILALGKDIPNWFPQGTGPESGFKTDAEPKIWSDPTRFQSVHSAFVREAELLAQLAASDTAPDVIATQYFSTGVACANCHKPFRVKRN